ncbi:hypothetical protein LP419_34850 [Massilia sp. H-1]|nr:hypothetical protein LP419_34850 [Massilia sp. H-1]
MHMHACSLSTVRTILAAIAYCLAAHACCRPGRLPGLHDSTVMTNGPGSAPQQGWGGRIHDLFTSGVSFSNRAVGGAAARASSTKGAWAPSSP